MKHLAPLNEELSSWTYSLLFPSLFTLELLHNKGISDNDISFMVEDLYAIFKESNMLVDINIDTTYRIDLEDDIRLFITCYSDSSPKKLFDYLSSHKATGEWAETRILGVYHLTLKYDEKSIQLQWSLGRGISMYSPSKRFRNFKGAT